MKEHTHIYVSKESELFAIVKPVEPKFLDFAPEQYNEAWKDFHEALAQAKKEPDAVKFKDQEAIKKILYPIWKLLVHPVKQSFGLCFDDFDLWMPNDTIHELPSGYMIEVEGCSVPCSVVCEELGRCATEFATLKKLDPLPMNSAHSFTEGSKEFLDLTTPENTTKVESRTPDEIKATSKYQMKKAEWLAYCIEIEFIDKSQLDELSAIYDKLKFPEPLPTAIEGETKEKIVAVIEEWFADDSEDDRDVLADRIVKALSKPLPVASPSAEESKLTADEVLKSLAVEYSDEEYIESDWDKYKKTLEYKTIIKAMEEYARQRGK